MKLSSPVGSLGLARSGRVALSVLLAAGVDLADSPPLYGQAGDPPPLFASHDPLAVTLSADFAALTNDRSQSPDRPAVLSIAGIDGRPATVPAAVRTRGNFRLQRRNCSFPPLRVDVVGSRAEGTVFEAQDKLKVVSPCRPGRSRYEQLVLLEYLAYRAYGILTERSFRVRLAHLTFEDTAGRIEPSTRVGFFIEEDQALAERLGATRYILAQGRQLPPGAFDPTTTLMTAIFAYMIGNTDWSDIAGHNVEILQREGVALAVPYDFDFSGLVDAPYATPDTVFRLRSVRDRYYRGRCADPVTTGLVLQRFRDTRGEVLALFTDLPGLEDSTRRRVIRYLQDFYADIESDDRAARRVLRGCRS